MTNEGLIQIIIHEIIDNPKNGFIMGEFQASGEKTFGIDCFFGGNPSLHHVGIFPFKWLIFGA